MSQPTNEAVGRTCANILGISWEQVLEFTESHDDFVRSKALQWLCAYRQQLKHGSLREDIEEIGYGGSEKWYNLFKAKGFAIPKGITENHFNFFLIDVLRIIEILAK